MNVNSHSYRYIFSSMYRAFMLVLHLGLLLDVFEQRLDGVRTRLSQRSKRVLLQSRSMKLAKLHRPHVSREEGLPQLQGWDGVLFIKNKKSQLNYMVIYIWQVVGLRLSGLLTPESLFSVAVYLNYVSTKGSPKALLLGIVKLIIGEVPGVLHLRLGHVLRWEK